MFAYGTEECPPVDVITGPGNVYVAAAKRLVQGRCGIDSEAGPTEIGILADDTAVPAYVAADLVAQAEHDPLAACLLVTPSVELLDAVDVELGKQVAGHPPPRAGRDRLRRPVGVRAGRRPRPRPRGRRRLGRRAPRGAHRRRARARPPRAQRRRRLRRQPHAGQPRRLPRRLQPRAAHRRHGALLAPGCRRSRSSSACRSIEYSAEALADGRAARRRARRRRRTCSRTSTPCRSASGDGADPVDDDLPGPRRPARASSRTARRSCRDAVQLNVNENPHAAERRRSSPTCSARSARRRATLNRYPDREALALRTDLAAYLSRRTGVPLARRAGLGGQRLQRGAAAGAAGVRRARPRRARVRAVVLDAPAARRRHQHRLGRRAARAPTSRCRRRGGGRGGRAAPPGRHLPHHAEQPDRHGDRRSTSSTPSARRAAGMVVVDEAYAEFAADAVARSPCSTATRGCWSAAR